MLASYLDCTEPDRASVRRPLLQSRGHRIERTDALGNFPSPRLHWVVLFNYSLVAMVSERQKPNSFKRTALLWCETRGNLGGWSDRAVREEYFGPADSTF